MTEDVFLQVKSSQVAAYKASCNIVFYRVLVGCDKIENTDGQRKTEETLGNRQRFSVIEGCRKTLGRLLLDKSIYCHLN